MEEKGFFERMFDDIGDKIKGLAKFSCWVGIIASIVVAIVNFVQGNELQTMLGWGFLVIGPIVSWISSWTLYGFGELIDKTVGLERHFCSRAEKKDDKVPNNDVVEQKFKCTNCNESVFFGETECKNCGQRFDWNKL